MPEREQLISKRAVIDLSGLVKERKTETLHLGVVFVPPSHYDRDNRVLERRLI
ncbi:MAG: hypothetical protein RIS36_362 [Pseudomonadota bacterium]|jgi:hypothetical protein